MSHDVFISYSNEDKQTADAICHVLEENKIKCWIAPRNVGAGKEFAEEINNAIENAKAMVFVFSGASQDSQFVRGEINLAFSNNIPIISFRIEDLEPKESVKLFLANTHWMDAYPNAEKEFQNLIKQVANLTEIEINDENITTSKSKRTKPKKNTFPRHINIKQNLLTIFRKKHISKLSIGIVLLAIIIICATTFIFSGGGFNSNNSYVTINGTNFIIPNGFNESSSLNDDVHLTNDKGFYITIADISGAVYDTDSLDRLEDDVAAGARFNFKGGLVAYYFDSGDSTRYTFAFNDGGYIMWIDNRIPNQLSLIETMLNL